MSKTDDAVHRQREPSRSRRIALVLETVWQEAAEDHLGAAILPGDSVIVK